MPHRPRVLAIGLDGYAAQLAARFMGEGALPALARLHREAACFALDHGSAQRTGLAFEHISTGLSPQASGRHAAVSFDPRTYRVWQEGTTRAPFPAALPVRTVVFDAPYFALSRAPRVRGVVGWGAHDPGVHTQAAPPGLEAELAARFGAYPASAFTYATPWASAARTRAMGEALSDAVALRGRAVEWLLAERCPDWDLALVVVSELHSAHEGLWHGVDPGHALHGLPSAAVAGVGLRAVYQAVDRLVGALAQRFPDASLVVFATGGMGPNHSDVASMVLLPELLYRNAFGRSQLRLRPQWQHATGGAPPLGEDEAWATAVNAGLPGVGAKGGWRRWLRRRLGRNLARHLAGHLAGRLGWNPGKTGPQPTATRSLDWMPAARYRAFWPRMPAFALPSFYDGRVRVNLCGREGRGRVPAARYPAVLRQLEVLVRECRDPLTGSGVVAQFECQAPADPTQAGPTQADLVVVWNHACCALEHPRLGRVGPVPWRRSGGHTGPHGVALIRAAGVVPGEGGVRSTFDVVPTLIHLLGLPALAGISGRSLLGTA